LWFSDIENGFPSLPTLRRICRTESKQFVPCAKGGDGKMAKRRRTSGRHRQLYLRPSSLIELLIFPCWPMYGAQIAFRNDNPARSLQAATASV